MQIDQLLDTIKNRPKQANHILIRATVVDDANELAEVILSQIDNTQSHLQVIRVESEKDSLGIDLFRNIKSVTSKKSSNQWQIIVVKNAQTMTKEAQNYLLKELEESNNGKLFILTSDMKSSLLPTLTSRTNQIDYKPPSMEDQPNSSKILFHSTGYSQTRFNQLTSEDKKLLKEAKAWLGGTAENRLKVISELNNSIQDSLVFIETLKIILFGSLIGLSQAGNRKSLSRTINRLKRLEKIETSVARNGNLKLNLNQLLIIL